MPVIMTVVFFVAVHLVPSAARSFTISHDATIRFTRQEDGGWLASGEQGVDMGVWYVEGSRVTTELYGERNTVDVADFTSVPAGEDWTSVSELSLEIGESPPVSIEIETRDDGATFTVKYDSAARVVSVEWFVPKE